MQTPIYRANAPAPYTFYRGGLNLGIFESSPPSPLGSDLLGNPSTGKAVSYKAIGEGEGAKEYAWVLILAPTDILNFSTRLIADPIRVRKNSTYDGHFNKSQSVDHSKNVLLNYRKGGYNDWYIPSRDELAFIAKRLPEVFQFDYRVTPMSQRRYVSSTYIVQNAGKTRNKVSLLLSQSFDSSTYGDTILVSDTKPLAIRPVRRVPVYII